MFNQKKNILSPIFAQEWIKLNPRCVDVSSEDVATIQGIECLFQNILQVIIPLAGITFFGMFLVGGFNYLISGGDPKKAAAATHTITMSFIGIIGVILSWLILLLIKNFTNIPVTDFTLPNPE